MCRHRRCQAYVVELSNYRMEKEISKKLLYMKVEVV